ncbi:ribosomal RNA small subunit methyltransferase A [Candidatus Saganbacteria bacterium]|nr:ribosomal RNA small subunit methyltransferase A [Candidatus Saganbacteria bacterium]
MIKYGLMNTPTLAQITRELLMAYNRFPRKQLGQHFLVDPMVLQRIIAAAEVTSDDLIVEIGSGLGLVTLELAKRANHVIAIEIDGELLRISQDVLKSQNNISFVRKDILKTDLNELTVGRHFKVVGNLPYYITSPILEALLTLKDRPEKVVIMTQKEVAERMAAAPGTKKYGSFSVFVQYYADIKLNSLISKSSFYPWPEVSSALVVLTPHKEPLYPVQDEKLFFDIMHAAFQQRRKQLRNSLADFKIEGLDFDFSRRPETVSVKDFVKLANELNDKTIYA